MFSEGCYDQHQTDQAAPLSAVHPGFAFSLVILNVITIKDKENVLRSCVIPGKMFNDIGTAELSKTMTWTEHSNKLPGEADEYFSKHFKKVL